MNTEKIGNVFLRLGVDVLPAFTTGEESSVERRVAALKEAKDKIIELSEADKNDALLVQDAAWHDIEDKHLADLAAAQAQVAVMAEVLAKVAHPTEPGQGCLLCHKMVRMGYAHEDDCLVGQALSAAPKVKGVENG